MPAKYKLVLRKDMRKDAQSTASSGDVKLILDELVNVMRRNLGKGEVVKVGELGSFQLQFGSTGTLTEKEFSHALIKSRRIVFRPGKLLKDAIKNYTFEKIASGAPDEGSAGGEDDRPGELSPLQGSPRCPTM